MSKLIIYPPTPFVCPVPGSFFPGQMVRIRGVAAPRGERFDINFQTTKTTFTTDDIAFHFSVRLTSGYVARNSFHYGGWGEEESYGDLPFRAGQHFEILILCEPSEFKVAINGRHFCDFKHRMAYAKISHFGIEGDVSLNLIDFEGHARAQYGQSAMATAPPPQYDQAMSMPSTNQVLPAMEMSQRGYPFPPT